MEQGGVGIDSLGGTVDGESVGIDGPGGCGGWSEGRCECGHRWPGGTRWMEQGGMGIDSLGGMVDGESVGIDGLEDAVDGVRGEVQA